MNDELHQRLSKLERMMAVQRDCIESSSGEVSGYMHGMLNGMIFSHSVISQITPEYHVLPPCKEKRSRVRHKGKK